jgi:two-component system chemotaxis sensor kinase CheA
MSTQNGEFLQLLQATFKVEAAEHLQAIAAGLLELEQEPAPEARRKIVETVFRAAHSLKGAARAVDFSEIEALCQSLEDAFADFKRQARPPSRQALDTLHGSLDAIEAVIAASQGARGAPGAGGVRAPVAHPLFGRPERPPPVATAIAAPATTPAAAVAPALPVASAAFSEARSFSAEGTVRIAVAKLDAHLLEVEEMLAVKLTAGQRVEGLRALTQRLEAWKHGCAAIEIEARALRQAIDRQPAGGGQLPDVQRLLEFLDWNSEHLRSLEGHVAALARTTVQDGLFIGRRVDELLEESKKLLLLPFGTLAAAFPKLVRDLCRDQGKEAELRIRGEEVEIDKRILEEMKDPLIHLLRNSIDHGIEAPAERSRSGKPARATITLAVSQIDGSKVQLLLSDDGAGIDVDEVKASAVKRGVVSAAAAAQLDAIEAQALIFESEVSTSPLITQLSGRGLGLAIVREKAEALGGEVSVESRPGQGTAFRVVLPATRATFRGILVEAAGQLFVVPTAQVERVTRARPDDVRTVEGRETISLDGRALSLVRLADVLELASQGRRDGPDAGVTVIVLGTAHERVAFAVEAVLDEQEVLVKPLLKPLARVRNVAAATVLGSGHVAPILNVTDLLRSARKVAALAPRAAAPSKAAAVRVVLVAEDSITSRMLIKGILESAGYQVKTAVDGMDAFTQLRSEKFDLVVSDVEMPRLNGFDLTARIRADKKLAEMPVVLVTALETRQDRERGIDVGANAYLVKSSFDQSNLVEAVQRLI